MEMFSKNFLDFPKNYDYFRFFPELYRVKSIFEVPKHSFYQICQFRLDVAKSSHMPTAYFCHPVEWLFRKRMIFK